MQETFIAVLRNLKSLREPAAVRGWVRSIAVRESIRQARAGDIAAEAVDAPAPDVDLAAAVDVRAALAQTHAGTPRGPGTPRHGRARRKRGRGRAQHSRGNGQVATPSRATRVRREVVAMNDDRWPTATLDPIRRARVLAAAIPGGFAGSRARRAVRAGVGVAE